MEMITNKDRVLDTLSKLPDISNKDLYALYPKIDQGSIRNYKHLFLKNIAKPNIPPDNKKTSKIYTPIIVKEPFHEVETIDYDSINIKEELIKIIKDYNAPASARVQAIREYNNIVELQPQETEEPLLKLLKTLEKGDQDTLENWPGNTKRKNI